MSNEEQPQQNVATLQVICGAILVMPLVYMGGAIAMRFAGAVPETGFADLDDQTSLILTAAFLVAGISTAVFSSKIKQMILNAPGIGSVTPETRFKAVMVAMALSESGAVMGFLVILLAGNVVYGAVLCGLSFAMTCFHFPSRSWLERGE